MKQHIAILALFFASLLFAKDSITIAAPDNGAVVSPLSFSQRFFVKTPIDQLEEYFKDPLFIDSLHSSEFRSIPDGVRMQWQYKGDRSKIHYEILLGEDGSLSNARVILPLHSTFALQNLIPGKTYFWCVRSVTKEGKVTAKSDVRSFTVEDLYPRIIALPDCWNVRDLGGRPGIGGRKTPYGKIYRSGGLNFNSTDGKTPGANTVTDESIKEALEVLMIRTEIDLRWEGEVAGMTQSPLGPSVQYIHIPTKVYGAMYTSDGVENFTTLFRIFTKKENYPIDFHCIAGADRTGTLAFLLEAVMGWSEEDIRRDYVYTTHYSPRYFAAIDSLIRIMNLEYGREGEVEPLQWKAERYLLRGGVSPEEIATFQRIIFGEDVPLSPALEADMKYKAFMAGFDQPTECKVVDNAPVAATSVQCGKEYALRPACWRNSPVKRVSADSQGRILAHLQNNQTRICCVGFSGLPEGEYTLVDFLSGTRYLRPDGKNWDAKNLASTPIPLSGHGEAMLVVTPIAATTPECAQSIPVSEASAKYYTVETLAQDPVIDGKLEDALKAQAGLAMTDISGVAVEDATKVYMAVNGAHDTLYVFMDVPDSTRQVSLGGHDSSAIWQSDCIELFLGTLTDSGYFHIIVSRGGEVYDEKNRDDLDWTIEGMTHAVAENENGWSFEATIPLTSLKLDGPLTLNACQENMPGTILRNLCPTGGDFHNSDARLPVLMK